MASSQREAPANGACEPCAAPCTGGNSLGGRETFGAFAAFLILSCLLTWPLARNFLRYAPANHGETIVNGLWSLWHLPYALTHGASLRHSGLLLAPYGFDLVFHTNHPVMAMLTWPVQALAGLCAACNTMVLLSLSLSALGFYAFCRQVPCSRMASFGGACAFAFSPFVYAHLPGHFNLVQTGYVPLVLLLVRRAFHAQRLSLATAACLGLAAWALAATDLYLTVFCILLLPALCADVAVENWRCYTRSGPWKTLAVAGVLAVLLFLPWILATMHALRTHDYAAQYPWAGSEYRITPAEFFTPPVFHPLWGKLCHPGVRHDPGSYGEKTGYLGSIVLLLSAIALFLAPWRRSDTHAVSSPGAVSRPRVLLWLLTAAVFCNLAMGNRYTQVPAWLSPFMIGRYLPATEPFTQVRIPARFTFGALTALCLCAAIGFHLAQARWPRVMRFAGPAILALLILDSLAVPIPVREYRISPWVARARLQGSGTLLAFPIGIGSGAAGTVGIVAPGQFLDQTAHHKPLLSAYLPRIPADIMAQIRSDRVLAALVQLQDGKPPTAPSPSKEEVDAFVKRSGIRWILLPSHCRTNAPLRQFLDTHFSPVERQSFDDADLLVL